MKILYLGILTLLAMHSARSATISITSNADSGPGSLRQALANISDGDRLDASSLSGAILLTTGELLITNSVTILGPGPDNLAVNGNHASRVFHIGSNTVVYLFGLTIPNGYVTGGDFLADSGGGILNEQATLTVSNCTLSGNSSVEAGGAIFNNGFYHPAALTVAASKLSNNKSGSSGGAIMNDGGYLGSTLVITNCTIIGNEAGGGAGGAIFNVGGFGSLQSSTTLIANSAITSNTANFADGGAIANAGVAQMTIADTTINRNAAKSGTGGGILNSGATLTVSNCSLSGNSSLAGGTTLSVIACGGIMNAAASGTATLTVKSSTISSNSSSGGTAGAGGIVNLGSLPFSGGGNGHAVATILQSTLSSNSANGFGGSIAGGGALNLCGDFGAATLTITNCTFSGNLGTSASGVAAGGAVNAGSELNAGGFGGPAMLMIFNSTFSANQGKPAAFPGVVASGGILNAKESGTATTEIGSTLFNAGGSGGNITNLSGTVISDGYNLSSDAGGGVFTMASDLVDLPPMLGPLQNNGGPTFTHALLPASPAIDKGKNFAGQTADQRGNPRVFDNPGVANAVGGDGSDIGAFEFIPPSLSIAPNFGNVALSWPTNDSGYRLESASPLSPFGNWTLVPGTPLVIGGQYLLGDGPAVSNKFYRLAYP